MSDNLVFRTAMNRVSAFESESVLMHTHHEAMNCRDCEAVLQMGIEAFQWIIRADQGYRADAFENGIEWEPVVEDILKKLFRDWLRLCERANKLIHELERRNYSIEHRDEFAKCYAEGLAIVQSFDNEDTTLPTEMAVLKDAAVKEHSDGEAAEFV